MCYGWELWRRDNGYNANSWQCYRCREWGSFDNTAGKFLRQEELLEIRRRGIEWPNHNRHRREYYDALLAAIEQTKRERYG